MDSLLFFKKKGEIARPKRVEAPKEFYPELPELELKEPEPLPLKPISAEKIREAVEKIPEPKLEVPEPIKFEIPFTEETEKEEAKEEPLEEFKERVTEFVLTKPVFIEGTDFRRISIDLNKMVKKPTKLKKLVKEEEKSFEELHNSLEDIQRKLILTDRTIFGG